MPSASLFAQFTQSFAGYSISPNALQPVYSALTLAYQQPHRHYHNLRHIQHLLAVTQPQAHLAANWAAVQWAIWYHDSVYDPQASDNETRSAEWAGLDLAALGLPAELVTHTQHLILATQHHTPTTDPDTALLLDADLSILGAEPSAYSTYAAAIRREYAWVADEAYRVGRAAVLERFLARPRIFNTAPFFAAYEHAARTNLQDEITHLQEQTE